MTKTKVIGIAINDYDNHILNNLENCQNDINTITSLLKSKYEIDEVDLLIGKEKTTRKSIFNFLNSYFINALEDENIILFYAGHGEYNINNKTAYWLTSDSNNEDASTWFSLNDLISFIKHSKAFHISIIIDSCFSGAIFENNFRGGGLKAVENKKSRLAITSGGLEKVKDGTKGNLSPFSQVLCEILEENNEPELPFYKLANDIILKFGSDKFQTPIFSPIENTGHAGGSLVLRLNTLKNGLNNYSNYSISLDFNYSIKIYYNCQLPKFRENSISNFSLINSNIESIAFHYISEVRIQITENIDYYLSDKHRTSLDINYEIHSYNEKYISLIILVEGYFGSAYPNNRVYSVNVKFKPDFNIVLSDIIECNTASILELIGKYSSCDEQKTILLKSFERIHFDEINFSFDQENLHLYFINDVIRAYHALGNISIPLNEFKLKI